MLALTLARWRQTASFLARRQDLTVYPRRLRVLGQIGGTDTERLLYWAMPVVFVLAGRALESRRAAVFGSPVLLTALVAVQVITTRAFFWPIPDYPDLGLSPHGIPLLTPLGARVPFLDLFSFFADRGAEAALLLSNLAGSGRWSSGSSGAGTAGRKVAETRKLRSNVRPPHAGRFFPFYAQR